MNRRATQQCNMSPYVYAVYWLPPASSAFLLARKCNWLAEKMLITCVMRHARLQKLQRFRRKMPFYSFLILWSPYCDVLLIVLKLLKHAIQGRSKLDNWGPDIHIFMLTHHKNNWFQKKLIVQNPNIWISAPQLSSLLRPCYHIIPTNKQAPSSQ